MAGKRREVVLWAGVAGLYALVTLPILLCYPPIWPDEALFDSPADSLARGEGLATSVLAGFIPGFDRYTYWLPPGYFVTLAVIYRLFRPSNHVLIMRGVSWILGLALLWLSWRILKHLSRSSWTIWSALLLLATHGTVIRAANLGRMDMMTLVAASASVVLYLRYLEQGETRWIAAAGFLSGLACLYHPAGVVAPVALGLHQIMKRRLGAPETRPVFIFFVSAAIPLLLWLTYILRAPGTFLNQFGAQLSRKASTTELVLAHGPALAWFFRPLRFSKWGPHVLTSFSDSISVVVFLAAVLLLLLPSREKTAASVPGLWLTVAFTLNLFTLEDWYPIYFVVPMVVLLGWGTTACQYPWSRALGVAALFAGIALNLAQAYFLLREPRVSWAGYKKYSSAIASQIPAGSHVLLKAIPDPYFGLQSAGKEYRFYEFVPEGIPVDIGRAEKALASIDYVVDSGCCNVGYLRDYLPARGRIVGGVMSPIRDEPPVLIWRLRRP